MSNQESDGERGAIPHWFTPGSTVLNLTDGDGAVVTDKRGNEYLDFIAQLYCVNAGHGNTEIISGITEQLEKIQYVSAAKQNETRDEFARELGKVAPGSLDSVLFSVTGSEANEAAVQIAREHTGAEKILTRWQSYHGGTYGAGGLTGDPETRTAVEKYAAVTGNTKFLPPIQYRSPFSGDTPEQLAEQAADHLEYVIQNEGPDSIAGILMEPVGGTSGAYPAPADYFTRVRELCNEYDILLIADEVITGFGRCGEWFGIQTEEVEPDMITFAKAATGAYVPLAGVIARPDIGDRIREDGFDIGQTFAGHPVGCAAGLAALDEYRSGLIENVQRLEPYFERRLKELKEKHAVVGDVRGRGFLWGVEFTDPETGEPFVHPWVDHDSDNPVTTVVELVEEEGVLIGSGRPGYQVILAPPLMIIEADIDTAITALDSAITDVF